MSKVSRLLRSKNVTVASLLDVLLPLRRERIVSYHEDMTSLSGELQRKQTFGELHHEVCAMSRFLVEEGGMSKGDRVVIYKTNDPRCFRWFMAIIRAGGVAIPLNPLLSPAEVHAIVKHCKAGIMVTDRPLYEKYAQSGDSPTVPVMIQSDHEPLMDNTFLRISGKHLEKPPLAPAHVGPDETVAIFHTSGTSGAPKGAMLSSRALLGGSASAAILSPFIRRKELALFTLPWAHIMAVSAALYGLIIGIPGLFLERFETARVLEMIEKHRITSFIGVPAMFIRILKADPDPRRLAGIRMWISASDRLPEPVRTALLRYGALYRIFGKRLAPPLLIDFYGMVELGGSAMMGIKAPFLPGAGDLCIPIPPFRVRIVDENGVETPAGQSGECQISGPGITSGYWENPEESRALMTPDGWLRTGDLAARNRFGLIRVKGRIKDVIKCGGYSIYSSELEEAIASHPSVARAAVIGVPHPLQGEAPIGIVELSSPATEEEILCWCRNRLAEYKAPRKIIFAEKNGLPTGVTEKVLKRDLREKYAMYYRSGDESPCAPETAPSI